MYQDYSKVIKVLKQKNIKPILYGSLGISLYLGNFKEFGDIDILIEDKWLEDEWSEFINLMTKNGYKLVNEKEHEFKSLNNVKVAFAKQSILMRDHICNPETDLNTVEREGIIITTLSLKDFNKAYTYSAKDGYRKNQRGKKDHLILEKIRLLTE